MPRYETNGPRSFWIFGTVDGKRIRLLGFHDRDTRDTHYGQIQTCGTPWTTMGRTDRAVTKSRALSAMGERFPGCTVTVTIVTSGPLPTADECADEADRRAEQRAWEGGAR